MPRSETSKSTLWVVSLGGGGEAGGGGSGSTFTSTLCSGALGAGGEGERLAKVSSEAALMGGEAAREATLPASWRTVDLLDMRGEGRRCARREGRGGESVASEAKRMASSDRRGEAALLLSDRNRVATFDGLGEVTVSERRR